VRGLKLRYIGAIILIAIIVASLVIIYAVYPMFQGKTPKAEPSNLSINLVTLYGKALTQSMLNVSISNVGGEAKGVSVSLNSEAFGQSSSSDSVNVPANSTVYAQCNAQIKDVDVQKYGVTISYNYSGAGTVNTNNNSQFSVLPVIDIVGVRWYQVGFIFLSDKSTIGPNDNTTIFFKITSLSNSWTYTALSATATTLQGTQGLTMTPSSLDLGSIGPQGTSNEFAFELSTHNTPLGKYVITFHVFSGPYEIAVDNSKTLTVSS
jgi:hypothetical protein